MNEPVPSSCPGQVIEIDKDLTASRPSEPRLAVVPAGQRIGHHVAAAPGCGRSCAQGLQDIE